MGILKKLGSVRRCSALITIVVASDKRKMLTEMESIAFSGNTFPLRHYERVVAQLLGIYTGNNQNGNGNYHHHEAFQKYNGANDNINKSPPSKSAPILSMYEMIRPRYTMLPNAPCWMSCWENDSFISSTLNHRLRMVFHALFPTKMPITDLTTVSAPQEQQCNASSAVRKKHNRHDIARDRNQCKEQQVHSLLRCICSLLPPHIQSMGLCDTSTSLSSSSSSSSSSSLPTTQYTIVDFGGGSGHLAIPLAILFPCIRVIVVDLGVTSLQLLHDKALSWVRTTIFDDHYSTIIHSNSTLSDQESMSTLPTATARTNRIDHVELIPKQLQSTAIPNLWTYYGAIESLQNSSISSHDCATSLQHDEVNNSTTIGSLGGPVNMAVALHLCGEATDVAIRWAAQHHVSSIIVVPCCVGKIQSSTQSLHSLHLQATGAWNHQKKKVTYRNPYVFQATGQNKSTVSYPQSTIFRTCFNFQDSGRATSDMINYIASDVHTVAMDDWNALAKAADYNSAPKETRTSRNATRRLAKALIERDRCLMLEEYYGYNTTMMKLYPLSATPKNDIIMAWKSSISRHDRNHRSDAVFMSSPFPSEHDTNVMKDLQASIDHLHLCCNNIISNLPSCGASNVSEIGSYTVNCPVADSESVLNRSFLHHGVEWSDEEVYEIQQILQDWIKSVNTMKVYGEGESCTHSAKSSMLPVGTIQSDDVTLNSLSLPSLSTREAPTFVFPTRMGRRKRKVIHYVAECMGLTHRSIGKKNSEKSVAVSLE
jgi:hypothetical protein